MRFVLLLGWVVALLAGGLTTVEVTRSQNTSGLGKIVVVDTAADVAGWDGYCSLREAIEATNINGFSFECDANGSTGPDSIRFSIGAGVPVINVTSALPKITGRVLINGETGGATRVELHGPGASVSIGLWIDGANASGSIIRKMVVNNFETAIRVDNASNVTIIGNYLGTDANGTSATTPNATGITVASNTTSIQIGGTNGVTPGGPCTGDCNLISGNGVRGIWLPSGFSSMTKIQGNFLGTDVTGTQAIPNFVGIYSTGGAALIGGSAPGAGNLISGNGRAMYMFGGSATVQGNFIGTDASGASALPNTTAGLELWNSPSTIGGSLPGEGNVISGNSGTGIQLINTLIATIRGNLIGTQADGASPLGNTGDGIHFTGSGQGVRSATIGGSETGQGNVIAFNGGDGVKIDANSFDNPIWGNSIHSNGGKGIFLNGGNHDQAAPVITGTTPIAGTACPSCIVELFSDSADEGRLFEGRVSADGAGNWTLGGGAAGPNITATATSVSAGNYNTSEFSAPYSLPAPATPTPTPSPTPTPTPTPTPPGASPTPSITSTATPTPTATATNPPTPTAQPTPSIPPPPTLFQGDNDCDTTDPEDPDIDAVDALVGLQAVAALPYNQQPDCVTLGAAIVATAQLPSGAQAHTFGDVDCDGDVDAVDALQILRYVAALPVSQNDGCTEIGEPL